MNDTITTVTLNAAEWQDARNRLRLAIDEAVRAEREACAKMADEAFDRHADAMEGQEESEFCYHSHRAAMARCIAAAIRNRSDNP